MKTNNFDIIFCGAGLANLSLIKFLIENHKTNKNILILDKSNKNINDKTYSFWAKNNAIIKNIKHNKWDNYQLFFDDDHPILKHFSPYQYYTITSLNFYNYVFNLIAKNKNIVFKKETVEKIDFDLCSVKTKKQIYKSKLIFNNLYNYQNLKIKKPYTFLKQHFKGWSIKTEKPVFKTDEITLMDLRLCKNNEIHFMYILPETENKALIEYTVFSENVFEQKFYNKELEKYISQKLAIKNYKIIDEEFGIIPMTDFKFNFKTKNKSVFNVGTIGGFVKASSGYSFFNTQKICEKIANTLIENNYTIPSNFKIKSKFKYRLYDSILLSAMKQKRIDTKKLFKKLYLNHNKNTVFKFLNEETTLVEELKIILENNPILVLNFFSRILKFWKW